MGSSTRTRSWIIPAIRTALVRARDFAELAKQQLGDAKKALEEASAKAKARADSLMGRVRGRTSRAFRARLYRDRAHRRCPLCGTGGHHRLGGTMRV